MNVIWAIQQLRDNKKEACPITCPGVSRYIIALLNIFAVLDKDNYNVIMSEEWSSNEIGRGDEN
jgi:hypothetical protein